MLSALIFNQLSVPALILGTYKQQVNHSRTLHSSCIHEDKLSRHRVYPIIYLPAIQPLTANAPIRLLEGKIE
ncbi:hypothetical protein Glove_1032g7 [Diversispora epigaea]|uniref:Uncharacterized protein n=1 Tax=Diversispora epigaea TaxID=1348612 RepID=A0A397G0G7_9GLOM|nr:hypothetical protein Glove_1032g7 [Diversispora epigaea]